MQTGSHLAAVAVIGTWQAVRTAVMLVRLLLLQLQILGMADKSHYAWQTAAYTSA
jgi:type II secretory pathway component PulL